MASVWSVRLKPYGQCVFCQTEIQWPVCGQRPSGQCVDRDPVASVWTETQWPVCGLSDRDPVASVWTETQWPVCGLRPSSQCVDRDPVASVWTVRPRPYGQCVFCQTETQLPVCGLSDQDSVNVEY